MCEFFSFVTDPENHGGERYYFDWAHRIHLIDNKVSERADSPSSICKHFNLSEDVCNKYEYNPLTKRFIIDQINNRIDDRLQAEEWVQALDFKKIVPALIIKPIVNPLIDIPATKRITKQHKLLLKQWDMVGDTVWDMVGDMVGDTVWGTVWDTVWDMVWAYTSSFFDINYPLDLSPAISLWNLGFVPSFDGTTWRLHAGKNAAIVYEISADKLRSMK